MLGLSASRLSSAASAAAAMGECTTLSGAMVYVCAPSSAVVRRCWVVHTLEARLGEERRGLVGRAVREAAAGLGPAPLGLPGDPGFLLSYTSLTLLKQCFATSLRPLYALPRQATAPSASRAASPTDQDHLPSPAPNNVNSKNYNDESTHLLPLLSLPSYSSPRSKRCIPISARRRHLYSRAR